MTKLSSNFPIFSSISQELMDEEEKEIHEAIENHMNTSYAYATRPKGIFVEKDDSKMIKLEGIVLNVFTQQGGKDKDR